MLIYSFGGQPAKTHEYIFKILGEKTDVVKLLRFKHESSKKLKRKNMTTVTSSTSTTTLPPTTPEKQPIDPALEARMHGMVKKVIVFIGEIKVLPNYLQELPADKLEKLELLTTEAHELLGLNPKLKLDVARKTHQEMKTKLLNLETQEVQKLTEAFEKLGADVPVNADGTLVAGTREGPEEIELDEESSFLLLSTMFFGRPPASPESIALSSAIKELDKVIRFQENPKIPLTEGTKFPLIDVSIAVNKLMESGLFKD